MIIWTAGFSTMRQGFCIWRSPCITLPENVLTFDVFSDDLYTDDYGLTEDEVLELSKLAGFDIDEARAWYNGVRVKGKPIYNMYAMMSFLIWGSYDCYWGRSGTMDLIID